MRNIDELPELWHGAYVEYCNGIVFLFGKNGEAVTFSDPDELWLRLVEITKDAGAVKPTARIPTFSPTQSRSDNISQLVQSYMRNVGVTRVPPKDKKQSKPLSLTLADLNL